MATLTVQESKIAGVALTLADATSGGDKFLAGEDKRTMLLVSNGDDSAVNVTITAQIDSVETPQAGALDVDDMVLSVAAGGIAAFGPFPVAYIDSSGFVNVSYAAVTSLKVAAVRLGA